MREKISSPPEMVVQDKKLGVIMEQLRYIIRNAGDLLVSKEDVCHVREAFTTAVKEDEKGLHAFVQELTKQLLGLFPLTALHETIKWFQGQRHLEFLEAKYYLGPRKKKSRFEAYKLVVQRD